MSIFQFQHSFVWFSNKLAAKAFKIPLSHCHKPSKEGGDEGLTILPSWSTEGLPYRQVVAGTESVPVLKKELVKVKKHSSDPFHLVFI